MFEVSIFVGAVLFGMGIYFDLRWNRIMWSEFCFTLSLMAALLAVLSKIL